ncbi:trafficking protein particle complex subunit 14-like [Ptychodera flava]|uniref:trafficking protein particle complex subunit 14-like n=1 Tax=Ptychodera flava TaxID=63121 RepID=UPI00396A356A
MSVRLLRQGGVRYASAVYKWVGMDEDMDHRFYLHFPSAKPKNLAHFHKIPQRRYVYHGETVQFLLVSEYQGKDRSSQCLQSWRERMSNLCASANASCLEEEEQDQGTDVTAESGENQVTGADKGSSFKKCEILSLYSREKEPRDKKMPKPVAITDDIVVFQLSVTLSQLPVRTTSCQVIVSLWSPEYTDKALQTHGYLNLFVESNPMLILQASSTGIKCNVTATMDLLSPPSVKCRHLPVAGKQYILVRVSNFYKDPLVIHNLQILPNCNENFLPPSPDGAHKNNFINNENISKYIDVNSISVVHCETWQLPTTLKPLEKHCVVFQVDFRNHSNHGNTESFEVPLLLALSWSCQSQLNGQVTITHYKLPRIKIDLPSLVMSASCTSPISVGKSFNVTYTILNNLQDFVSVKLLWNPEKDTQRNEDVHSNPSDSVTHSLICQDPFSAAGYCQNGSTLSFTVSFLALNQGVFEIGQHMKLKLQYTASFPTGGQVPAEGKLRGRMGLHPDSQYGTPSPDRKFRNIYSGARSNSLTSDPYYSHFKGYPSPGMRSLGSTYSLPSRGDTPSPSPSSSPNKRITTSSPSHSKLSLDKIVKRRCQIYAMA